MDPTTPRDANPNDHLVIASSLYAGSYLVSRHPTLEEARRAADAEATRNARRRAPGSACTYTVRTRFDGPSLHDGVATQPTPEQIAATNAAAEAAERTHLDRLRCPQCGTTGPSPGVCDNC